MSGDPTINKIKFHSLVKVVAAGAHYKGTFLPLQLVSNRWGHTLVL